MISYHTPFAAIGYNSVFSWTASTMRPGFWWVMGNSLFVKNTYAVVDDFGNLVPV